MNAISSQNFSQKMNLPQTLSEFIEIFNQEINLYLKVADLSSFADKYLANFCEVKEKSERVSFFEFVSKIPLLFDNVSIYNNNTENEEFQRKSRLQCYHSIIDVMMQSLKYAVTMPEVLLMLQPSLNLLYKGYNHCKECETIYGNLLEEFKDPLASLFNKMQEFQEVMELKFQKILDCKLNSDQFHLLKPIICDLNKLCELVFSLDSSSGIDLYKNLIKLFETYEELGYSDLQINSVLIGLFSEITNIGDEFKIEIKDTEQVPVQESRMFLFKLNVVKKIVKMFPSFIKENLQSTINFVLHLYELLISCYYKLSTENGAKCLRNILVENMAPLLSLFYSEKTFLTSVLLLNYREISSDLQMAHVLLKLSAFNVLLASPDKDKLPEKKDVVENVFLMLGENTTKDDMLLVSLRLPLSLFSQSKRLLALRQSQNGQEPESITLYYHTYLHLSEYFRTVSEADVLNLESFVVNFLLTHSSATASSLISDIWIYRLRYGSAESLYTRCISLSKELSHMESNGLVKLLLKRMTKFLPFNLKKRLYEEDELLKNICNQSKTLHRYGAPKVNNSSLTNENFPLENISALLDELKNQNCSNNTQLIRKACCILELCALSVNVLEIQEFLRITDFATCMFKSEIYEIQIAVLTFLRTLNFKKFNDKDPLFSQVRSNLAILYNEALRSKNYIVRLEAFSVFYTMAQLTDIRISQETIGKFADLFPGVKAYVSETPQSGFLLPKEKSELWEKQISHSIAETKRVGFLSEQSKSVLSLLLPS